MKLTRAERKAINLARYQRRYARNAPAPKAVPKRRPVYKPVGNDAPLIELRQLLCAFGPRSNGPGPAKRTVQKVVRLERARGPMTYSERDLKVHARLEREYAEAIAFREAA